MVHRGDDLTPRVRRIIDDSGMKVGVATVWVHHTSASLIICENADPTVRRDLEAFVTRLVPDGDRLFTHTAEEMTTCPRTCAPS